MGYFACMMIISRLPLLDGGSHPQRSTGYAIYLPVRVLTPPDARSASLLGFCGASLLLATFSLDHDQRNMAPFHKPSCLYEQETTPI